MDDAFVHLQEFNDIDLDRDEEVQDEEEYKEGAAADLGGAN